MTLPIRGRGRPPKFGRKSRTVTLTLPEDVIARLGAIDADLGRAIVTVAELRPAGSVRVIRPAELKRYGRHAVIVVTQARKLKRLPGVQLVPIGSGRALISLDPPHSIVRFEVDVRDVLERDDANASERQMLEAIADILREARRARGVVARERTIIVLESRRQRRSSRSS